MAMLNRLYLVMVLACSAWGAPAAQGQDCAWEALTVPGGGAGVNNEVRALTVFDDGSGPALYAGGFFTTAGGVTVNRVARWDGNAWSALEGPGGVGVNNEVFALTVFDDGSAPALYAGGRFTTAGGVTVNRIARWDGSVWSALEGPGSVGANDRVYALTVFDDGSGPALYAGGSFTFTGGVRVNRVARWDGSVWSALEGPGGVGVSSGVYALTVFDDGLGPALYAGGHFITAGGEVTANDIARWDGSVWSALEGPGGVGVSIRVLTLTVFDDGSGPALYAGGWFLTAGGVTVNRIARWDGSVWSALEGPGGVGVSTNDFASIGALTVFDDGSGPALYAGGEFTTAGGGDIGFGIASWDGSDWSALTGPGVGDRVHTLTLFDDGSGPALYAGGEFATAGGGVVNHIARWDGSSWTPLGSGVNGLVWALTVFDDGSGPALYAGGEFTTAGGVTVNHVARWDGSAWSALDGPDGAGTNRSVYALTVFDDGSGPALYAGGEFTEAGGGAARRVARWDGSAWSALDGESIGAVRSGVVDALKVFDDGSGPALYAGGQFSQAGGNPANNIARWDGSSWSPLGAGMIGSPLRVLALTLFDDGSGPALYAGGSFATAGGVTVNGIARWDGSAWSALGTGVSGSNPRIRALTVFDDGSGPALYAGGWFTEAGGSPVGRIARWDGSVWSPLGVGMNEAVRALAVFDDGSGPALYAGGEFTTAGGLDATYVARWRGCPPECAPDLAPPFGILDIFDVLEFLTLFEAGDPAADFAPPFGVLDIFDVIEFLALFEQGCL